MNIHENTALLDAFVDGELTSEEMISVQSHLDECPECRAYVDDALAIRASFPTWYPSGYQCTEVYCRVLLDSTKIRAQYSNGESEYSITIHRFTTALKASKAFLEKDSGEFDVRNINGIDYYILSNVDNRNVTWTVDNLQVVISGDLSDEEINSMIDSINEG